MPKFITIGYGDQSGYDRTASDVRKATDEHDSNLRGQGVTLRLLEPLQVCNRDSVRLTTTSGQFISSSLPLASFALIDAADLGEANKIVSQSPCATAHSVVKVWPLEQA